MKTGYLHFLLHICIYSSLSHFSKYQPPNSSEVKLSLLLHHNFFIQPVTRSSQWCLTNVSQGHRLPPAPLLTQGQTTSTLPERHSLPSAFLTPLSFLTGLFSHYNLFQGKPLYPTLKAFSDILFLEEIKVKCLSITCFQSHFSLLISPWVHHPHKKPHSCALYPCMSTCILC